MYSFIYIYVYKRIFLYLFIFECSSTCHKIHAYRVLKIERRKEQPTKEDNEQHNRIAYSINSVFIKYVQNLSRNVDHV